MSAAVEMLPVSRRFSRDPSRPKPRACRNLFGKPNKEELDRLLATELQTRQEEEKNKYNFDFCNDAALESGRFEWSSADPQDIPAFYRPVTVTHGKRFPQRTYPSLASEASGTVLVPVQSANTDSNTSALPLGLQARLQGHSSSVHVQPQPQSSRTEKVEEIGSSSASKSTTDSTTSTTQKARRQRSKHSTSTSTTNQPKITDFLRQRKRGTSTTSFKDDGETSEKRRRTELEACNSASTTAETL